MLLEVADWKIWHHEGTCYARAEGRIQRKDATEAVHAFVQALDAVGRTEIDVVLDLVDLEAYDRDARVVWSEAVRDNKSRIRRIVFVLDNPVFRMAAGAVGLFVGISMTIVGRESRPEVPMDASTLVHIPSGADDIRHNRRVS